MNLKFFLLSSLIVAVYSRLYLQPVPDNAIQFDSTWLAHLRPRDTLKEKNSPEKEHAVPEQAVHEEVFQELLVALEQNGFPIIKTLRDQMVWFDTPPKITHLSYSKTSICVLIVPRICRR